MIRARSASAVAVLSLGMLAGCGAAGDGSSAPTDEAIVGGIETVGPQADGLTALGVVDAIEEAGAYDCEETGSAWECTVGEGSGGGISVTGSNDGEPTVTGSAPIDAATVAAIAAALGAPAEEVYSADTGLAWPVR